MRKRVIYDDDTPIGDLPCRENGNVYFLASPTHVKIGFTESGVKKRIRTIRQNHYEKLELLGVIYGASREREKEIHKKFAAYKVKGEWFLRNDEIMHFIRYARK